MRHSAAEQETKDELGCIVTVFPFYILSAKWWPFIQCKDLVKFKKSISKGIFLNVSQVSTVNPTKT